jgi:hypothetical protein
MKNSMADLSLAFTAGAVGGVLNGLIVWLFGLIGITAAFGVQIAPALTSAFIYQKVAWGGLWGLIFLLPIVRLSTIPRGLILSLAPTLVQLLVVFPFHLHKGWFGLGLGILTPALVVIFNAVWGVVTAVWFGLSGGKPGRRGR